MNNILDLIMNNFKTYELFELCGIPIKFNLSFLLVGVLLLASTRSICISLAAIVSLVVSLLAHELGHSIMARKFGYKTDDITMTVLGGCAAIDVFSRPMSSEEEMKIAIAGPVVSFILGIGSALCLAAAECISAISAFASAVLNPIAILFACMMMLNIVLGLFNLIPAFPMDGGRVLRAWLARKKSRIAATETAVKVAKIVACILVGLAVLSVLSGNIGGITACLIALFIWNAGSIELKNEKFIAMHSRRRN